jgi:hypothetical protein
MNTTTNSSKDTDSSTSLAGARAGAFASEAARIRAGVGSLREARQVRQVSHAASLLKSARNARKIADVGRNIRALLREAECAKQAIAGAE